MHGNAPVHSGAAHATENMHLNGCMSRPQSGTLQATRRLRMTNTADRIEKKVLLKASRERVWRAITEAEQFGTWFGVEFEGEFVAGRRLRGKMVPTQMDAEIARQQEAYAGVEFVVAVERIEPMRVFSFRWHPYELEPGTDEAEAP